MKIGLILPMLVAPLVLVAACGPLVQIGGNDKAPIALLTLRATAAPVTTTANMANTLSVATPTLPGPLQTLRLPVIQRDTELAYLTGATWAEQPNKLFARVLIDTIAARGVAILDARQTNIGATRLLTGQLLDFSLDVRDASQPKVTLRYDALLTGDGGKTLTVRRFERSAPVTSQVPGDVAVALNGVANAVAADVAAWVTAR
jgi:cholesterol transport system auxiliary component